MVKFVIGLNILISLLGFYAAWRLGQWRKKLSRAADELTAWSHLANTLWQAPGLTEQVLRGQQGVNRWRQQYSQMQLLLRQLQQLLKWAGLVPAGLRLWQRTRGHSRSLRSRTFQRR